MLFEGDAIPDGDRVSVLVNRRLARGKGNERVGFLDVVKIPDDGNGRLRVSARFEVPLEIADPENKVSNDRRAWIHFYSEQLMRIDGQPGVLQHLLRLTEGVQGIEHLAFKALHVFQSDVEEVSASARRVEDTDSA